MTRKILLYTLLLWGLAESASAQSGGGNSFISGFNSTTNVHKGDRLFASLDLYSGGVCYQYAGACSALVDDFTFLDKNPAASSLIYSGPFIGFAHRNYILDDSIESIAFAHSANRLGFGGWFKYAQSILNSYSSSGIVENIFSPNEILFGANLSYNTLRTEIVDGISLGLNIKGGFAIFPEANAPTVNRGTALVDIGTLINIHALKIIDFPRPNFSAGLSYRNVGLNLIQGQQPNIANINRGALTLGIAYLPISQLLFSTDMEVKLAGIEHAPVTDSFSFSFGLGIIPLDSIEVGAGLHISAQEYFITAGASITILGTQIRFVQRIDAFTDATSLNNFTISVSLKVQNTISVDRQKSIQTLYINTLQALLEEDLDRANELINQLLIISPGYGPAREMKKQIDTLRKVNNLI